MTYKLYKLISHPTPWYQYRHTTHDLPPQAGSRCALAPRVDAGSQGPRCVVDIFHLGTSSLWVNQRNTYDVPNLNIKSNESDVEKNVILPDWWVILKEFIAKLEMVDPIAWLITKPCFYVFFSPKHSSKKPNWFPGYGTECWLGILCFAWGYGRWTP